MMMFIILILSLFQTICGMEIPQGTILVKDQKGDIALAIDYKTFENMQEMSAPLQDPSHPVIFKKDPKGYTISLPLTTEQILLLFDLANTKDVDKLLKGPLNDNDIKALRLTVIALELTDNHFLLVDKTKISIFFKTLEDFMQQFEGQFILQIPHVKKIDMVLLYSAIKDIPLPPPTLLEYNEWLKEVNVVKNNIENFFQFSKAGVTTTGALLALKAAHWLQADLVILAALYDLYTTKVPENIWEKTEDAPWLKQIKNLIDDRYPSIESLLKSGKNDFFTIKKLKDEDRYDIKIEGAKICRLEGLYKIPSINKCSFLIIENTSIVTIKSGDFENLPNLLNLFLRNNKNLSSLEKGCFDPLTNLTILTISNSNISTLKPDIFTLPHLKRLILQYNHVQTIKSNWAAQLQALEYLGIVEPDLESVEPLWGYLIKLGYIQIYWKLNPNVVAEIDNEAHRIKNLKGREKPLSVDSISKLIL